MTKLELIERIHGNLKNSGLSKTAVTEIVDSLFENLGYAIKKDKRFSYPGFGTWTVRSRKSRKGRNPQTGAVINIKASRTVGFRPSPNVKESL